MTIGSSGSGPRTTNRTRDPTPRWSTRLAAPSCPGLVDSHSHLTLPGGAHWIDRGFDPADRLLRVAEHNARLQRAAGVRWARDVGSPMKTDPVDGRTRALGPWRTRSMGRPPRVPIRARGRVVGRTLRRPAAWARRRGVGRRRPGRAAVRQLDDGADFVKLYLDGPDTDTAPFTVGEVRAVVDAAHQRGARVTAHSGQLAGAKVGAEAGVDSLEHGFQLDADVARTMAANGVAMVSTLAVLESWRSFATTTSSPRFAEPEGRATDRRTAGVGARERTAGRGAPVSSSRPAPTSAAARSARTSWRGRSSAW